jgi:hypothetical protein
MTLSLQSLDVVRFGPFEDRLDIRRGTRAAIAFARAQDRSYGQPFRRFGQQQRRRGRPRAARKVPKNGEGPSCRRMRDVVRLDHQREPRHGARISVRRRQRGGDVEQFLLRQADHGTAHQRAESQRVAGVGKHACERNKVLNLLAPEQSFAGLGRDRKPAGLERLLVSPEFGARRSEQRDVSRLQRAPLFRQRERSQRSLCSSDWLGPWVACSRFLITHRVGQGLNPRSWPPHVTAEAVRETLIKTCLIELRQSRFVWKGRHGSTQEDRRRYDVRQHVVDGPGAKFGSQRLQVLPKLFCQSVVVEPLAGCRV